MEILPTVRCPEDVRRLNHAGLRALAAEIRAFLVSNVSRTGGHLGPNLGAVELTLAVHRVFHSPADRILWDTGHQSYVHKVVTGRADGFTGLRQRGGLSGYPSRIESEHDVIENSHASTALSYADGLLKAYALSGASDRRVVAVVGDGALTGGMAWEALNNLGAAPDRPVVVVLNDNGRSYAPTIGGLAEHLRRLRADGGSSTLFSDLGFAYLGPVDGHDVAAVEEALRAARDLHRPAVVHCVTVKGRGWQPAEYHELDQLHAVRPLYHLPAGPGIRTWTDVFADQMVQLGEERTDVVALTAAMLDPTGLTAFQDRFPDRIYDVGIAEQHAVVSAAGLALGGMHPVVCLYATFLNRAVDQVLMDVALHGCGVTFVLDRAGVTGDDGPSHNGMWDLSLLQIVPGLAIAAPRDSRTLKAELREAVAIADRPTVVRFPKGAVGPDIPAIGSEGGVDVLSRGKRPDVLVVSVGAMARTCLDVADRLAAHDIGATVVDPRWVKPVNPMLPVLAREHRLVVTVEDNGRVGGVGAAVSQALQDDGVTTPVRVFGLPARFPDHGKRTEVLEECQLTAQDIARAVVEVISRLDSVHSELVPRAAVDATRGY